MAENVARAAAVIVWCIGECRICGLGVFVFGQHRWGEEETRGGSAGRECGRFCRRRWCACGAFVVLSIVVRTSDIGISNIDGRYLLRGGGGGLDHDQKRD